MSARFPRLADKEQIHAVGSASFPTSLRSGGRRFGRGSDGREVLSTLRAKQKPNPFRTQRADARALPPFPALRSSLSARRPDLFGCRLK
jgi:hypothetical protein